MIQSPMDDQLVVFIGKCGIRVISKLEKFYLGINATIIFCFD